MVDDYKTNSVNLPAGRVAELRPLSACVKEGVSNTASTVFLIDAASGERRGGGRGSGDGHEHRKGYGGQGGCTTG